MSRSSRTWAHIGLVATILSAVGWVAISHALSPLAENIVIPKRSAARLSTSSAAPSSKATLLVAEDSQNRIEGKLDGLLVRLEAQPGGGALRPVPMSPTTIQPTSPTTMAPTAAAAKAPAEKLPESEDAVSKRGLETDVVGRASTVQILRDVSRHPLIAITNLSLRTIQLEIRGALEAYRKTRAENTSVKDRVKRGSPDRLRDEIQQTSDLLAALSADLNEQAERLMLERQSVESEKLVVQAKGLVASSVVERYQRINKKKVGMVSAELVAEAETEVKIAEAQVGVAQLKVEKVNLELQQLETKARAVHELWLETEAALKPSDRGLAAAQPKS